MKRRVPPTTPSGGAPSAPRMVPTPSLQNSCSTGVTVVPGEGVPLTKEGKLKAAGFVMTPQQKKLPAAGAESAAETSPIARELLGRPLG